MARRGFSLVELMVVVAIIGILAMIAIPSWTDMQNKARRAEVPPIMDGIKTAQLAYEATNDAYVTAAAQPRSLAGDGTDRQAVSWPTPNAADWAQLDWRPDGDVRGVYATWESTGSDGLADFCVHGQEGVAGDGTINDHYASGASNGSATPMAGCGSSSAT